MLKIYNSITRKKQVFNSIEEGKVGMYVCGPTVYGYPHVGHARTYINFDVVYRYLKFLGYKVKYVQNITDVGHLVGDSDNGEDKIAKQAKAEKVDAYAIAHKYEDEYFKEMKALNVCRPTISCRATENIDAMIKMTQAIIDKGYAYVTDEGNVYYDVDKFEKYGQLTNRKLDKSLSGERISIASDKHNNADFALWKRADENHLMKWDSPWGEGCPGWHIECSAMSKKFLGAPFDIHGGGIDNIFPHHECEFAQSEIANGKPFVNYFMHNNLITVNGTKMGKSLGNFINLKDLFNDYDPMVVRYFILNFHYRTPVDFNKEELLRYKEQYYKLNKFICDVRNIAGENTEVIKDDLLKNIYDNFVEGMNEDFNTPLAISELLKVLKLPQNYLTNPSLCKQLNYIIVNLAQNILGLNFTSVEENNIEIPKNIIKLADERKQAKANKNYTLADSLRNQILQLGYLVTDKVDGYTISKK